MESKPEGDRDQIVIHGPQFVSSTRFGGVAYAPVPEGDSQFTVQKLDEVGPLTQPQLDLIEEIRKKSDDSPSPYLTPVTLNLDDDGLSWIAWESGHWPTVAKLLSDCERRLGRKEVNLENLAGLFRAFAVAIDECRENGWESPHIDFALERTYVSFESNPSPSELWKSARTELWPPFTIKLVPFPLNYLFPLSRNPEWHENPFVIRFASFVFESLGGKMESDGVPMVKEYRGGLISMGQSGNSYLRSTLNISGDRLEKLSELSAEKWLNKLLEAEGLGELSGIFTKTQQPSEAEAPKPANVQEKTAEPETPEPGKKNKTPLVLAAVTVVAILGGVLFVVLGGGKIKGDFQSVTEEAIRLQQTGDTQEAVRFLLFAAENMAETLDQTTLALEMAFSMKSVAAAEKLAELEKSTYPGSAVNRYRTAAGWCRDGTQVLMGDRTYDETKALAAAAALGDGQAFLELGKIHEAANRLEDAQTALASAASILAEGNGVTQPNPELAAETHELLFRDFQNQASYDWLITHYRTSDPTKSAALAETAKDFKLAASLFSEAGQWDKAAAAAVQGEDFEFAETAYLTGGTPDLAVAMWEKRSEVERAAQVWLKTEPKQEEKAQALLLSWIEQSAPARALELLQSPILGSNPDALYRLAKLQDTPATLEAAKKAYGKFYSSLPADKAIWKPEWAGWREEVIAWRQINDPSAIDEKEIQTMVAAGDFPGAAGIYEGAGRLDDAVDIWLNRAENPDEAVAVFRRAKLHEKAVEIWDSRGEYERAAEYWNTVPDQSKAAAYSLKKGQEIEAADPIKATALYTLAVGAGDSEGNFRIGRAMEDQDLQKALENYSEFAVKLESLPRDQWKENWADYQKQSIDRIATRGGADWAYYVAQQAPMAGEQAIAVLKKDPNTLAAAGSVLEKLKRLEEAAEIYFEAKQTDKGAAILIQLGRLNEAADAYADAGQKDKGITLLLDSATGLTAENQAPLYEKVVSLGDPEGLYHLGLIEEETRSNPQQAADRYWDFYQQLGSMSRDSWRTDWPTYRQDAVNRGNKLDPVRFGDPILIEQAKSLPLEEGVQSLIAIQKIALAGQLYLDANQPDKAVQLYAQNQLFAEAATLLASLERIEEAADMWVKSGDPTKANRLLIDEAKEQSDQSIAKRFFEKAISLGDPEGHFHIGFLIEEPAGNLPAAEDSYLNFIQALGPLPRESWDPAWPAMRSSAFDRVKAIGSANSLQKLADQANSQEEQRDLLWQAHQIWLSGNSSTPKNAQKADSALLSAATAGHPIASRQLGDRSEAAENWPEALQFFRTAASQPIEGTTPEDDKTAIAEAAEKVGNLLYQNGDAKPGITKNEEEALRFYAIAADAGNINSMRQLGFIHGKQGSDKDGEEKGTGRADYAIALKYYELAAEAGSALGALSAAFCYAEGKTGTGLKDTDKAKKYFQRAHELGNPNALKIMNAAIKD